MENPPKISLFASAVRIPLWEDYLDSLKSTSVPYEVIFSGFNTLEEVAPFKEKYPEFKYIHTARIKPTQNYFIASQHCVGETVSWSCDDANYSGDVMGKAYRYWKSKDNNKLLLSIQTKESGYNLPEGALFDMRVHRFFAGQDKFPLMCPMNLMSREFYNDLGGYDKRYVCGQAENDLCMRAYLSGGTVEIFGNEHCYINIDHLAKSIAIGESKVEADFLNRPFARGYSIDRQVLESSYEFRMKGDQLEFRLTGPFEPYEDKDLLTKSQGNNLPEMWI